MPKNWKPPTYDIARDDRGWYLTWDTHDMLHGRRLETPELALETKARWEREDKEAAEAD